MQSNKTKVEAGTAKDIRKAISLWESIKSRAKIYRRKAMSGMSGDVCYCFITEKQGLFLMSLCRKANMEHPSSQDVFALEMGIGLSIAPAKFGFRCDWQEFSEQTMLG